MNEKYRPLFIRIGVIVLVILVGAIGLTRYLTSRGDAYLAAERERAEKLGWLAGSNRPHTITPAEQETLRAIGEAYDALEQSHSGSGLSLSPNPDPLLTVKDHSSVIRRSEAAAQILSDHLPALEEAAKLPLMTPNPGFAERRTLTFAMSARAMSLVNEGDVARALGTLRVAHLLSALLPAKGNVGPAAELDSLVRWTWAKIAVAHPNKAGNPPPVPPALLVYSHNKIRDLIRDEFDSLDPDPLSMDAKRWQFERFRDGSNRYEDFQRSAKDVYSTWQFLQRTHLSGASSPYAYAPPSSGVIENEHGELSAFIRNAALREQLSTLFLEGLKNGGSEPSGLKASRDPFNSSKPLKFRKISDGWAVYSIGPDGRDLKGTTGDMVFKISKGVVRTELEGNGRWR